MPRSWKYIARLLGLCIFGSLLGNMLGSFVGLLLGGSVGAFYGIVIGTLLGMVWAFKKAHTMRHLD